ncbi:Carbohydrate sulfotransferase 14, partial [Orchesella cincta]
MKKLKTLLKSVVFSFLIYMWFLGSTLLIQIDSQHKFGYFKQWDVTMQNLTRRIDSYCKTLERDSFRETFHSKQANGPTAETVEKLLKAKKEKIVRDNIIYIPELQQMWCLVPKAASTSWSRKIVELVQSEKMRKDLRNQSVPLQVILRKYYGNIGTKIYKEQLDSRRTKKILLVRHPFSRLVSAFEDKLKNRKAKNDSMYFYGNYGVKINRSFRKNRRHNKKKEPTFEEFIEYLLNTNPMEYDEHWKPISLLCGLCHVKYDLIIKQEYLGTSALPYIMQQLGFETLTKLNMENQSLTKLKYKNITSYFKFISPDKIEKLRLKYTDDFNIFGYDY